VGTPFPPRLPWIPPNASGVLGPRPGAPTQVYPAMYSPTPVPPQPPAHHPYTAPCRTKLSSSIPSHCRQNLSPTRPPPGITTPCSKAPPATDQLSNRTVVTGSWTRARHLTSPAAKVT
jgi:hypothetical protein